ncbi:MAG: NADH-quinone oxidoreductase subunit J, partial [Clostridia bacterium]|nr:NADH-quinone oxidoreductase subunit J [Clostridia bacterium]
MEFSRLSELMRENGVVGAGGAGFPSYAKLNKEADTVILNCAECEPLLKLHRQVLENYSFEILSAFSCVMKAVGAENGIIAIKKSYSGAIDSVNSNLDSFKNIKIGLLPEVYPSGDEVLVIYETTGRRVEAGKLPISVGCIVYNV